MKKCSHASHITVTEAQGVVKQLKTISNEDEQQNDHNDITYNALLLMV